MHMRTHHTRVFIHLHRHEHTHIHAHTYTAALLVHKCLGRISKLGLGRDGIEHTTIKNYIKRIIK